MRIGFVELKDGREGFDRAAEIGGSDRAGEFEVGGDGEIGVGVEIDSGFGAGDESGAIGLAHGAADEHFGRIEDAEDGLAAPELVAFLGVAHGIVAVEVLVSDDAGKGRVEFEPGHVAFGAVERHFLAVALEFEDAEGGDVGLIVEGVGLFQAFDVFAGGLEFDFILETVDFAEGGSFLELDLGFGEIGLGLAEIGQALFGIGPVLGGLLIDLMAEIVEFGLGVAGVVELLSGIEQGDEVTFFDAGAVRDEFGEGHGAALAVNLRDEDFRGMDGFEDAGDADFVVGGLMVGGYPGSGGVGNLGSGA